MWVCGFALWIRFVVRQSVLTQGAALMSESCGSALVYPCHSDSISIDFYGSESVKAAHASSNSGTMHLWIISISDNVTMYQRININFIQFPCLVSPSQAPIYIMVSSSLYLWMSKLAQLTQTLAKKSLEVLTRALESSP